MCSPLAFLPEGWDEQTAEWTDGRRDELLPFCVLPLPSLSSAGGGVAEIVFIKWYVDIDVGHVSVSPLGEYLEGCGRVEF